VGKRKKKVGGRQRLGQASILLKEIRKPLLGRRGRLVGERSGRTVWGEGGEELLEKGRKTSHSQPSKARMDIEKETNQPNRKRWDERREGCESDGERRGEKY